MKKFKSLLAILTILIISFTACKKVDVQPAPIADQQQDAIPQPELSVQQKIWRDSLNLVETLYQANNNKPTAKDAIGVGCALTVGQILADGRIAIGGSGYYTFVATNRFPQILRMTITWQKNGRTFTELVGLQLAVSQPNLQTLGVSDLLQGAYVPDGIPFSLNIDCFSLNGITHWNSGEFTVSSGSTAKGTVLKSGLVPGNVLQ